MTALLECLMDVADQQGLPIAVGLYTHAPAPDTYLVTTPIADTFDVFVENPRRRSRRITAFPL